MDAYDNHAILSGTVEAAPEINKDGFGDGYYRLTLAVPRQSGTVDHVPVLVPRELGEGLPGAGEQMQVEGQVRACKNPGNGWPRVSLAVLARHISPPETEEAQNAVELMGVVKSRPTYRITPFWREICELMLGVDQPGEYEARIPCLTWGLVARETADLLPGDIVSLEGRFQSREFQKRLRIDECVTRTAYEISARQMILIERPEDGGRKGGGRR